MRGIGMLIVAVPALLAAQTPEWKDMTPEGGRVTRLAVDPVAPDIIYAATTAGLFKTVNAGANWSVSTYNLGLGSSSGRAPGLILDPRNSGTIYIADCELSKSTDGGSTWRNAGPPLDAQDNCILSVAIDPTDSATLYAAGRRVYKSTDAGASWTAVSGAITNGAALLIDSQNSAILYATGFPAVVKSMDGGATWAPANSGLPGSVEALAIDPVNSGTLYAGYKTRVFKTTDGGANWMDQSAGLPSAPPPSSGYSQFVALAVDPRKPSSVYALILQSANQIVRFDLAASTDGGATWTTANDATLASSDLLGVAIDPRDGGNLYLGTTNGVLKSVDGGRRWSSANTGLRAAAAGAVWSDSHAILAVNQTVRLLSGPGLFRSTDAGASWTPVELGARITDVLADAQVPGRVYAWSGRELFKSDDAGANWSTVGSDDAYGDPLAIDPSNPSVMYKGVTTCNGNCDDRIYKSVDAGRTWMRPEVALQGRNCCSFVRNLAIDPRDSNVIYAGNADDNETGNGLWRSLDAGKTWTNLGAGDIYAFAIDPKTADTMYAVWNCCVYKSTDAGQTWAEAISGLARWPVGPLVIDPVDSNTIYVGDYEFATRRAGVFRSTDGGASWSLLASGLRGSIISLAVDRRHSGTVYAGTSAGLFVVSTSRNTRVVRR